MTTKARAKNTVVGLGWAERVSLGLSSAILVVLIGLVIYAYWAPGPGQAIIEVQPQLEAVRRANGVYYLPVEVGNTGRQTVEEIHVQISLTTPGRTEAAEFTVPSLAGGETDEAVVVFRHDPATGEIGISLSFLEP